MLREEHWECPRRVTMMCQNAILGSIEQEFFNYGINIH